MIQISIMNELRDRRCRICDGPAILAVCENCVIPQYDLDIRRKPKKVNK